MLDLLFIAIVVAFLIGSYALIGACERLREGGA
jgi:hypothetical protein